LTEEFLEKLTHELTDVVLFVVEDLSWEEQQILEALQRILTKRNNKKIFVIHNYKSIDNRLELSNKIEKFIISCYEGTEVPLPLIQNNGVTKVWSYIENLTNITHFVLGKDTKQDWLNENKNDPSYSDKFSINVENQNVINIIQTQLVFNGQKNTTPFLKKLFSAIKDQLNYLFLLSVNPFVYYNHQLNKLFLKISEPIQLTRIVNYDGLTLLPGRTTKFSPRYSVTTVDCGEYNGDILQGWLVTVEVPGFLDSNQLYKDLPGYKSKIEVKKHTKGYDFKIEISGFRELYYKTYNSPDSDIQIFSYGETNSIVQRNQGDFKFELKLDVSLDPYNTTEHFGNGLYTVFIPPRM